MSANNADNDENIAEWWRGAVIYHVYLRSFRDSNGDGVGDLRGCIEGLDYIVSLGVDAIWLSPFFTSPMCDFGYDVADYCDVDPAFGTLDDFDELVESAHQRGLRVVIDQVFSHTSDRHAWFEESRSDRLNPKADWYVWADPRVDGSPPNNWQSVFGGGAWEWDSRRHQYFLHNFLASQPDLNVHNPDVQDALLNVARFWLDRDVDGFRLDAINFAMHDPELRDNPPATKFLRAPSRPFEFQEHRYNQSHPDIVKFLERVRALMDEYPGRFTVAEVGGPNPIPEMKEFTRNSTRLHSAYSFDFLYAETLTRDLVKKTVSDWPGAANEGWPSWAFSNHDAPRAESRWCRNGLRGSYAKFTLMLLMSLRGNAFLYQGEELGLEQADIPFDKLQDPEAIRNWPETLGRDGARTPLPWCADREYAGFSSSEPWLPIDKRHLSKAIDLQHNDPGSALNFARSLIELRKKLLPLTLGGIEVLDTPDPVLVIRREYEGEQILCVFNLSRHASSWTPEDGEAWSVVLNTVGADEQAAIPTTLHPESGYIAVRLDTNN